MGKMMVVFFSGILLFEGKVHGQLRRLPLKDTADKAFSIRVLPQNFYNQHLSFFCKKELQLQKLTSLPIFIRAGSKEYVDYLEGKPNAGWLPKQ